MYVEQQQDIVEGPEQNQYSQLSRPSRCSTLATTLILLSMISISVGFSIADVDSIDQVSTKQSVVVEHPNKRIHRALSRADEPDDRGYFNVYIRESCRDGRYNPYKEIRFPYARYERQRLRYSPAWIRFSRWMPIYVNRFTRHTMLYSGNGVYILPPLINYNSKMISVAELMAYGYATLINTGVPMPSQFNIAYYAVSGSYYMRGMPRFNPATRAFMGGVQAPSRSEYNPDCDSSYEEHTGDEQPLGYGTEQDDQPDTPNTYEQGYDPDNQEPSRYSGRDPDYNYEYPDRDHYHYRPRHRPTRRRPSKYNKLHS
ncbi:unnamed protein product [Adineta ricciae]|uniref:Uncharacterized protein n=1 Tax=Adineta ricciae TaxID=249248 RepID=A0A815N2C9_ADIRI|nr:unnamed protein product [Adineta ricciae]